MTLYVSVGNSHKKVKAVWVSVGGVWKKVRTAHCSVSNVWKQFLKFYTAIGSSWQAFDTNIGNPGALAWVQFNSNGTVTKSQNGTGQNWCSPADAGSGAAFYMYAVRTSGTALGDINQMLPLTSPRQFTAEVTNYGQEAGEFTINFYAYSGGALPIYGVTTPSAVGTVSVSAESEP